jgi:predicted nucleic acid-binding Zn ribbon protein
MTRLQTGDDPQPDYGGRVPARRGADLLFQDPTIDQAIEKLDQMPETASVKDLNLEVRRRRRSDHIVFALAVVLIAVGYLFAYRAGQNAVQNNVREQIITSAMRSLDQTNAERVARGLSVLNTDTTFDPNSDDALIQALAAAVTARVQSEPQFSSTIPGSPDAGSLHCPGGKYPNTVTVMTPNGAKEDIYVCV